MKTKLTLLSLLLFTALTAMDEPKVFIEPITATMNACTCDEWDCNYQGGPNSGCRRTCYLSEEVWVFWFEYKPCGYCPDPESLCP